MPEIVGITIMSTLGDLAGDTLLVRYSDINYINHCMNRNLRIWMKSLQDIFNLWQHMCEILWASSTTVMLKVASERSLTSYLLKRRKRLHPGESLYSYVHSNSVE